MANRPSIVKEFFQIVKARKAYWMVPIILVTLFLAALLIMATVGGGAAAPFIYTLF